MKAEMTSKTNAEHAAAFFGGWPWTIDIRWFAGRGMAPIDDSRQAVIEYRHEFLDMHVQIINKNTGLIYEGQFRLPDYLGESNLLMGDRWGSPYQWQNDLKPSEDCLRKLTHAIEAYIATFR